MMYSSIDWRVIAVLCVSIIDLGKKNKQKWTRRYVTSVVRADILNTSRLNDLCSKIFYLDNAPLIHQEFINSMSAPLSISSYLFMKKVEQYLKN